MMHSECNMVPPNTGNYRSTIKYKMEYQNMFGYLNIVYVSL